MNRPIRSIQEMIEAYRLKGLEMGFKAIVSGPFVRHSYNALQLFGTKLAASIIDNKFFNYRLGKV